MKFYSIYFFLIFPGCVSDTSHNFYEKGKRFYDKKNYDSAAYFFQKIVDVDSLNWGAQRYLGLSLRGQEKFESSKTHLLKVLDAREADFETFYTLGEIYYREEDNMKALNAFLIAYRTDSVRDNINYNLGLTYWKGFNAVKSAKIHLQKEIGIDSLDAESYVVLGQIYLAEDKYDTSFLFFSKAIYIQPTNKAYYLSRGLAYLSDSRYEDAVRDFSKSISIDSLYLDAYFYRGNAFLEKGNLNLACSDFQFLESRSYQNSIEPLQDLIFKSCN